MMPSNASARRPAAVPPQSSAVPGLPTLASARASLRVSTARARNRRQLRQARRKEAR